MARQSRRANRDPVVGMMWDGALAKLGRPAGGGGEAKSPHPTSGKCAVCGRAITAGTIEGHIASHAGRGLPHGR